MDVKLPFLRCVADVLHTTSPDLYRTYYRRLRDGFADEQTMYLCKNAECL